MSNLIVLGAQWGDEGKGKVVDLFSEHFDIVARYQGGHNAGHTVYIGEKKFVLKLIPAEFFAHGVKAVIGNGVVIDPAALIEEMTLSKRPVFPSNRNWPSARALTSSSRSIAWPRRSPKARSDRVPIGTTSRGIGPCYEDKIGRRGIRIADLLDPKGFDALYNELAADKATIAQAFHIDNDLDFSQILAQYKEYAQRIAPMVTDTCRLLNDAIKLRQEAYCSKARRARCSMLITERIPLSRPRARALEAPASAPVFRPTRINGVIGVSKAYITRVGSGAFPSEEHGELGDRIRKAGNEFGSVTGRPRRCGWFDVPLLRYTAMVNGFDSLIVTKLDVLDELAEIPGLRRLQVGWPCRSTRCPPDIAISNGCSPFWSAAKVGNEPRVASPDTKICHPRPTIISTSFTSKPESKSAVFLPVRSATKPWCSPAQSWQNSSPAEQINHRRVIVKLRHEEFPASS